MQELIQSRPETSSCELLQFLRELVTRLFFPRASTNEEIGGIVQQAVDAQAAILGPELATLVHETACEGYIVLPRTMASIVPTKENPLGKASTRVTLLGDAAHAMTTHRGIGANTAFTDAFDLANALMRKDDPWQGIAEYEQTMIKRGFEAVRASKQTTEAIHTAGVKSVFRNTVIRALGWVMWAKELLLG